MSQSRKMRLTGLAVTLSMVSLNLAAMQPASAQAGPGDPIKGAKGLIQKMINMKEPNQFGEMFTNESAAAVGMLMTIPVAMMSAMAGQPGPNGKPNPMAGVAKQLEVVTAKYGITNNMSPNSPPPAKLLKNGRGYLTDIMGLLMKLDPKSGKEGANGFNLSKDAPKSVDDMTYKVISPTRVKLTPKKGKDEQIEARFEDSKWRLHVGSFKEMMSKMQQGGMKPGRPGGPPPTKP